jgi:hypothetical protein
LRRSISAVEIVGDADAERNFVKARALGEVVADMIDLLRKTNRSRLRADLEITAAGLRRSRGRATQA